MKQHELSNDDICLILEALARFTKRKSKHKMVQEMKQDAKKLMPVFIKAEEGILYWNEYEEE